MSGAIGYVVWRFIQAALWTMLVIGIIAVIRMETYEGDPAYIGLTY